jgi:hypothetical protein
MFLFIYFLSQFLFRICDSENLRELAIRRLGGDRRCFANFSIPQSKSVVVVAPDECDSVPYLVYPSKKVRMKIAKFFG